MVDQFGRVNSMAKWREVRPIRGRSPLKSIPEIIRVCFSYWGEGKSGLVIYIGKQILKNLAIDNSTFCRRRQSTKVDDHAIRRRPGLSIRSCF